MELSTGTAGNQVAIQGRGVAALCCKRLLPDAGFSLLPKAENRSRVPAILLGERTQELLRDIYGRPELFRDLFQIDHRIVMWGRGSAPVELPHRAAVVSEEALAGMLKPEACEERAADAADWRVYASRPIPAPVSERHFGSRRASATPVQLKGTRKSACWIESLDSGWLFVVPESAAAGWLLAVGDSTGSLLAQSRLIAGQVEISSDAEIAFPAHPRIADPLCAPGWLACGAAALGFDPLCGDGTGNAVREAILAAAVIRAAIRGERPERLLAHYRARLTAGLWRHLELCRSFYSSANCGPWWAGELARLEEGIAWCRRALDAAPPFEYRLNGFDLEAVQ